MAFPLSRRIIANVPPTGRLSRPGAIRFYEQKSVVAFSRSQHPNRTCLSLTIGTRDDGW